MAIDYSGYAQSYGGGAAAGAAGQTIGRGLARIPSFQERYGKYRKSALDETTTNPLMNFLADENNSDLTGYKGSAASFAEYAKELKEGTGGKGKFFGRRAERKGLVDARGFVDRHRATVNSLSPQVAQKIYSIRDMGFKTDKDMKKWVASRPELRKFILDNYPQGDPQYDQLRAWAKGDETWKQWWDKKGLAEKAGMIAGPPLLGLQGYRIGKDLFGKGGAGFGGRYNPFGKKPMGGLTPKGAGQVAKGLGWEGKTTALDKKAIKSAGSAQSKATRALNQAKKLGKSKKVITGLEKTREAATIANKAAKVKAAAGPTRTVVNFVKKKGMSGLIKKVIAKVGYRGAAKLLGRGAISLGLKGTGIGAVGSLLLDATTIYMIYNIIKDVTD